MTKILIAAAALVAAALFASGPTTAEAKPSVPNIQAPTAAEPLLVGNRGHKWRRHHRWRRHVLPRWRVIRKLRRRGYHHCRGHRARRAIYKMRCTRHGHRYAVRVNGRNGRIVARWRIG